MFYEKSFGERVIVPNNTRELDEAVFNEYASVTEELIWEAARAVGLGTGDQYNRSLHGIYIDGCLTSVVCGAKPDGDTSIFTLCANKFETSTGSLLDQETVTIDNFVIWKPYKKKPFRVANNCTTISRYPDEQWNVPDYAGPLIFQTKDNKVHFKQGDMYSLFVPPFQRRGRPNTREMIDQTIITKRLLGYLSELDGDSIYKDVCF